MPNFKCPACGGRLREKGGRLAYTCRSCGEVVIEIGSSRKEDPT
jgi:tRNA(Ile2) C34 agmatinyltransferase TiaS